MYQLCTILCTGTCTLSIVSLPGILKAARLPVCVCVCVCMEALFLGISCVC